MQFLVVYHRSNQRLLELESFPDEELENALGRKLRLELQFAGTHDVEIALFECKDEATLKITHSRYFQSAADIAKRLSKAI